MILTKKRYIEYISKTKALLENTNIDNKKLVEINENIENKIQNIKHTKQVKYCPILLNK